MFPHNEATKKHICFISFFASGDANRDGKISENEMAAALKMLNPKISPETQQTAEKLWDGMRMGSFGWEMAEKQADPFHSFGWNDWDSFGSCVWDEKHPKR